MRQAHQFHDRRKPDFSNLLAVLARKVPARPTLFEFFWLFAKDAGKHTCHVLETTFWAKYRMSEPGSLASISGFRGEPFFFNDRLNQTLPGRRPAAARGGYALGTGNSIPMYVPDENYLAIISAIRH